MAGVLMQTGSTAFLKKVTGYTDSVDQLHCHLYTNNHTPVDTDGLGAYTEVVDSSYVIQDLHYGTFTYSNISGGAEAQYNSITFNFSTGQTIYGYFLTLTDDTTLIDAEEFSTPQIIGGSGGSLDLSLVIPLITC